MNDQNLRTGPKGLDTQQIVETAVAVLEEGGEEGFSVRKLAARVGCDPMAVLYHFGNKKGLERAIAEWLNGQITLKGVGEPWDSRLMALAMAYRALALQYPGSFPLLLRFWTTGPADLRLAEYAYVAFAEAGHCDTDVVDLCLGWYASILGLAAADAGGLLRPAADARQALSVLDPLLFPMTSRLRTRLEQQGDRNVYERFASLLVQAVKKPRDGKRRLG